MLASANPDKAAEIIEIVSPLGLEVAPRPVDLPDVDETADTLEGNARLKAMAVAVAAGAPALADDTGLEVDALDGAPGVRTARYAGEHARYQDNVEKLLGALRDVPSRWAHRALPHRRGGVLARRPRGARRGRGRRADRGCGSR